MADTPAPGDECIHPDFAAAVTITPLDDTKPEGAPLTAVAPTYALDITAACSICHKPLRFHGPIGIAVGPGTQPMVSVTGTKLHASGHMGDPGGPSITVGLKLHLDD